MRHRLFGEWLSRFVPLSPHDISEILAEQEVNSRPFGDIALAWGLCRPQHVWRAWWNQLASQTRRIDLLRLGVDSQAVGRLPLAMAQHFLAIPLRAVGRQVVIAAATPTIEEAREKLPRLLPLEMCFVAAPADQVVFSIRKYYPPHADLGCRSN